MQIKSTPAMPAWGGFFETKKEAAVSAQRRADMTGAPRVLLESDFGSKDALRWHHMAFRDDLGIDGRHRDFSGIILPRPEVDA